MLPGVGRKTANVVLGNAYGINEGITVDTHVTRLSRLLGLTRHDDPVKIEQDLMTLFPQDHWAPALPPPDLPRPQRLHRPASALWRVRPVPTSAPRAGARPDLTLTAPAMVGKDSCSSSGAQVTSIATALRPTSWVSDPRPGPATGDWSIVR